MKIAKNDAQHTFYMATANKDSHQKDILDHETVPGPPEYIWSLVVEYTSANAYPNP